MTDQDGFIGMLFAVTLLWLLTHGIFDRHRSLRGPLLTGGVCVAISQFYPALQFVAGAVSVTVASRLIPITDHGGRALQKLSMPGAILATMLTGGSLLVVAVVIGMVVRRIRKALGWVGAEPPKDIKHYREIIS